MMFLHPAIYNLEKYEEFAANEVLRAAQRKKSAAVGGKGTAKGRKKNLQPHFA